MTPPVKPRVRSGYSREETDQVISACLTVAVTLGALRAVDRGPSSQARPHDQHSADLSLTSCADPFAYHVRLPDLPVCRYRIWNDSNVYDVTCNVILMGLLPPVI